MTMWEDQTVVVTGGAGFIGSHVVDRLAALGARVAVIDIFFLGKEENLVDARAALGDRLTVYREDAGDPSVLRAVCQAEAPSLLLSLATKPLLYSFFNPRGAFEVNVQLALSAVELVREGLVGRLVHVSSSEVYGTARAVPMSEDHPLLGETTYAAGKAAADLALVAYARMFDLPVTIVRPFNNYGPRQNADQFAAIVPITVRRILRGEPPIIEGDGLQTRDFLFVEDTARAVVALAERDLDPGTIVNIGSGHETAMGDLIQQVADLLEWSGGIEHRPPRVADVRRHLAEVGLAESLIGPPAQTPLRDGLAQTVRWYQQRGLT